MESAFSSVKTIFKISNSQVPPGTEPSTCFSKGSCNLISEDVIESTPKRASDFNYTVTKCMAYEFHKPVPSSPDKKGVSL